MDAEQRRAVRVALRERAESRLAAVTEQFGDAPRREPLHFPVPEYGADTFPETVDEQLERIAGVGGALVTDDDGRVLCVDVSYNDNAWESPGGAVEPGDSLPETARKEVREETGVEVELTGLLYTRLVAYDYGHPEVAYLPMAVFTAEPVGGTLTAGGNTLPDGRDEIADVAWFEPGELPEGTLDREWILAYCRT